MGLFFSRGRHKSKVTEQDHAILELKQQRDKLKQVSRKTENQLEHERQVAKELIKLGKKEKALLLLKKKRCLERLIDKCSNQLLTIETLVHDLEYSQIQVQVVNGLKSGNEALKKIHEILSLDEVERIMDDTRDAMAYQEEIDAVLFGGLLPAQSDSDLEDELSQLVAEAQHLPDVPTHSPIRTPATPIGAEVSTSKQAKPVNRIPMPAS